MQTQERDRGENGRMFAVLELQCSAYANRLGLVPDSIQGSCAIVFYKRISGLRVDPARAASARHGLRTVRQISR